jgi:hypothetical protein
MNNGDPSPVFGSWRKAYCVALAVFGLEVALLYAFTIGFS